MPLQVERHCEGSECVSVCVRVCVSVCVCVRVVGGRGLAGEGPRRQHLGFASFRLLPLDGRHVGEKAEDGVTDLMCLQGDGEEGERPAACAQNTDRRRPSGEQLSVLPRQFPAAFSCLK